MNNIVNQVAYLRTSREFPEDLKELVVQLNKSYLDTANAINARTIGLFPTVRPAITGESWYLTNNQRQQSLRQVYKITSFAPFNHNINFAEVSMFSKITGIAFDGTLYYPLPYVNGAVAAANIGLYVTPTQVIFTTTAPPGIVSGIVILEWISNA